MDKILFRPSSAGKLMTEPRSKSETLSETTKKYLVEVFINHKYRRFKDISNKYIAKGLQNEEDSLDLYSLAVNTLFEKNEKTFENDFIKGTPDIIHNGCIIDVKSSFDIFTFYDAKTEGLNKMYYWQLQCYMWLTDCQNAKLVYCLTDTPLSVIADQKRKLLWQMGVNENDSNYLEACQKIDDINTYIDIPIKEKYFEIEIKRNDDDIEKLQKRILDCRTWIKENLANG